MLYATLAQASRRYGRPLIASVSSLSVSYLYLLLGYLKLRNKFHHQAIVVLLGIIILIVSFFKSGTPEGIVLKNFGIISLIFSLVLILFEKLFWNIPVLYPWFVPVPNLNGNWMAEAKFTRPEDGNVEKMALGKAVLEQSCSDLYMRIIWSDEAKMEFFESTPLAISGNRTKHYALTAIYQFSVNNKPPKTRSTFMSFSIPAELFKNKPEEFKIFYSTTDGQHGEMKLTRNTKS